MKLKARILEIQAGGRSIAILDDETASFLGVHSSDRVRIAYAKQQVIAIANVASSFPRNCVGLYEEISRKLGVKAGESVDVQSAEIPEAIRYVQT